MMDLKALKNAGAQVRNAELKANLARIIRNSEIVAAAEAGAGQEIIADAAGITQPAVNKILREHRNAAKAAKK